MFGSVIPEQLVEFFEAPGFLSNSVVFAEVVFLNFAFVEADSMFSRAQGVGINKTLAVLRCVSGRNRGAFRQKR
jgi:hypothetical protein